MASMYGSIKERVQDHVEEKIEHEPVTDTPIITSNESSGCTYIVEPVAFIQNIAFSIMDVCFQQFIYDRILTRLITEPNNSTKTTTMTSQLMSTTAMLPTLSPSNNKTNICKSNNSTVGDYGWSLSPNEHIRNEAQSQTAHLLFILMCICGTSTFVMGNLLGVNCSVLGRKTLIIIYLFGISIDYSLTLFQSLNSDSPDWIFYLGALAQGMTGSFGVFNLALCCYISDLTSIRSRSYRITLLASLNSIACLSVTFICGYVIKWYGFSYLFMTALAFKLICLVYTILFVPEPLIEIKDKSILQRLKMCSFKRVFNCFTVYFSRGEEQTESEREPLLGPNNATRPRKQTLALLLLILGHFFFSFVDSGTGSILTLFIMNAPFCFDSVQISNFTVFSTSLALLVSLFISKCIRINDILICVLATAFYFGSTFFLMFGKSLIHIYMFSVVVSPYELEYSYVRSIVSKSVGKDELSDALSLILMAETITIFMGSAVFQYIYSSTVSGGITVLLWIAGGILLASTVCHMINFFIYVPIREVVVETEES